ncbi:amidophosphoribosyltransferase [Spiromyces aspiralis]|uniref:Amidophosphoribosyltransferase n=1 Tax=Spiromyces aspiralis TaxID=68401 RepID=A0ACC1HVK4_9FUNG|nr:amidophosphoribosyltransferase [Spiromyces aspiralis]
MVRDVLTTPRVLGLIGCMGVGHVRYPTAGTPANSEAQPFYVNSPYGIVMGHNGNLTNAKELEHFLDYDAHRHVNTDSDSELLLNIFAYQLQKTGKFRQIPNTAPIAEDDIFTAITEVYKQCRGAYACVGMIAGFGIMAFRDPHGIRPLVFGRRKSTTTDGYDYMFASESIVLNALEFTDIRDVKPGEAIIISKRNVTTRQIIPNPTLAPCIFEYVYFARPDSIIDGVSVYDARVEMGVTLARKIRRLLGDNMDIDVVIPVPDTSRPTALQLSQELGLRYREGFNKNRYVGRTFIMPGQEMRRKNVRRKLNAMAPEFQGKNVLIVDDSIVRGTTSQQIIQMAREAGAKKVYFASAAPPLRYPNVYGIDMPSMAELVANGLTEDDISSAIGADKVIFQDKDDLINACRKFNPSLTNFDTSVFDGKYVTNDITEEYLQELEESRSDKAKAKHDPRAQDVIGLYNMVQNY